MGTKTCMVAADSPPLLVLLLLGSLCFGYSEGRAEFYVGGQLGYTWPNGLTDVRGTGTLSGATSTDFQMKNSLLYGAKAGYFLPGTLSWLGFEVDAYNTNPNLKQQTVSLERVGTFVADGSHARIFVTNFNLVARAQLKTVEPYIGAGLALFFAELSNASGSISDNARPGINVLAGFRSFLTNNTALFMEYKLNYTEFNFKDGFAPGAGLKADYLANNFAVGVSYHFR